MPQRDGREIITPATLIRERGNMATKKRQATIEDLIEQEPGRLEAIWREIRVPAFWTMIAFGAMSIVVLVGTTERGEERVAEIPRAVATLVGRPMTDTAADVARVGQELAALRNETLRTQAERARLEQRLALVERGMDDVTGSIRRIGRDEVTGSIPPAAREMPPVEALPAVPPAQPPQVQVPPIQPPQAQPPQAQAPTPAPAAASPPSPLPTPLARPEAAPAGGVTLATRTQFGIDIGSEPTLSALRLRWQRLAERHATLLGSLEPVIAIKDGPNGQPVLSIVAGPIGDVSEAAALCARLRAAGASACQPASFDGQRLALR